MFNIFFVSICMKHVLILLACFDNDAWFTFLFLFCRGLTTELSFSLETTGISSGLEPVRCSELTIFRCEANKTGPCYYVFNHLKLCSIKLSAMTEMFSCVIIR